MTKKTGLGKGLNALLSSPIIEEEKMQEGEIIQNLSNYFFISSPF